MENVPQSIREYQEGYALYAAGALPSAATTEAQARGYRAARLGHMAAGVVANAMALGASAESADHVLAAWQKSGARL